MDIYSAHMDPRTGASQVAEAVRRAMEQRGVSQLGLAEATLIPRATLIRRLQGVTPFTITELALIASHLDMQVSDLLVEESVA